MEVTAAVEMPGSLTSLLAPYSAVHSAASAGLQIGDAVAHLTFGSFASWGVVKAQTALPCKRAEAPMLVLLTSGLTASIGEDWPAAVVPAGMWTVVWLCSPGFHAKGAP